MAKRELEDRPDVDLLKAELFAKKDSEALRAELEALRAEGESLKARLQLIEAFSRRALEKGAAFGGELRLAQHVVAICEGKL